MDRYLIHLEHDPEPLACAQVVETFLRTGSHYLARADWGCADGDHASWMIVEAADREEARRIVPAQFRSRARVVRLVKFTLESLGEAMRRHERGPARDGVGQSMKSSGSPSTPAGRASSRPPSDP